MSAVPMGLWDTTVTFEASLTNFPEGVEWLIKAPLGLIQKAWWRIVPANSDEKFGDQAAEWVFEESMDIIGSRLLAGIVARKCEGNFKGIHQKFVEVLQEGVKTEG